MSCADSRFDRVQHSAWCSPSVSASRSLCRARADSERVRRGNDRLPRYLIHEAATVVEIDDRSVAVRLWLWGAGVVSP